MSRNFSNLGGLAQAPCSARVLASVGKSEEEYAVFVADEGILYPTVLASGPLPLSRWLLVKTDKPEDVWKVGLEAIQTGLFGWILLRPSRACHPHHLRKLQLSAERTRSRVLILSSLKLPHWMMRGRFAFGEDQGEADTVLSGRGGFGGIGGGMPRAHAQSVLT